jgi:hypothetical protein
MLLVVYTLAHSACRGLLDLRRHKMMDSSSARHARFVKWAAIGGKPALPSADPKGYQCTG